MDWKAKVLEEAARKGAELARAARDNGAKALATARQEGAAVTAAKTARVAAMNLPYKELAVMCGRTGVAGAMVDGAMGGVQAIRAMSRGEIDATQAVKHTGAEAGCGFVTSASGTAGTLAVYMITGAMGPMAIAAGMGASVGSRYVYRKIVGETLPGQEDASDTKRKKRERDEGLEDIGPRPQED